MGRWLHKFFLSWENRIFGIFFKGATSAFTTTRLAMGAALLIMVSTSADPYSRHQGRETVTTLDPPRSIDTIPLLPHLVGAVGSSPVQMQVSSAIDHLQMMLFWCGDGLFYFFLIGWRELVRVWRRRFALIDDAPKGMGGGFTLGMDGFPLFYDTFDGFDHIILDSCRYSKTSSCVPRCFLNDILSCRLDGPFCPERIGSLVPSSVLIYLLS